MLNLTLRFLFYQIPLTVCAVISPTFASEIPNLPNCASERILVEGDSPEGHAYWCEKDSLKDGAYWINHKNGTPKVRLEFVRDQKEGHFTRQDERGQILQEGDFHSGKMTQGWHRFYPNGKLKDEGTWTEGVPDGLWRFYRPDGGLEEEGYYENGVAICLWKKYSEQNAILETVKANPSLKKCAEIVPPPFVPHQVDLGVESGVQKDVSTPTRHPYSLTGIGLDWLVALQNLNGFTLTGEVSWRPTWNLTPWMSLIGQLGVSAFNAQKWSQSYILVFDGGVGARFLFQKEYGIFCDTLVEIQTLVSSGAYVGPMIRFGYDPNWFGLQFLVGGRLFFLPASLVQEFTVGIQFDLEHLGKD